MSHPRSASRRAQEALWARERRKRRPRVSPAWEATMRAREAEDVRRIEARERAMPSRWDAAWLRVPEPKRRCRCPECGALSPTPRCPNGHAINDLPMPGAA